MSNRSFEWEPDPLFFVFHDIVPGKVKMHTRKLDLKDWIMIDETYPSQMKFRNKLINEQLKDVYVSNDSPTTSSAKKEIFEMLVDHLTKRFPDIFEIRGEFIYNVVREEEIPLGEEGEDYIIRSARLVQEDLCLMEWNDQANEYVLTAAVLCFPSHWMLREKWNRPMSEIHNNVPHFQKHLLAKVKSLFKAMKPECSYWRALWSVHGGIQDIGALHTPMSEDTRTEYAVVKFKGEETGFNLALRTEYQTLRKLRNTNSILFGIRTYQRYFDEFKRYPLQDSVALLKAIECMTDDQIAYKGGRHWRQAAMEYLKYTIETRKDKGNSFLKKNTYLSIAVLLGLVSVFSLITLRFNFPSTLSIKPTI